MMRLTRDYWRAAAAGLRGEMPLATLDELRAEAQQVRGYLRVAADLLDAALDVWAAAIGEGLHDEAAIAEVETHEAIAEYARICTEVAHTITQPNEEDDNVQNETPQA